MTVMATRDSHRPTVDSNGNPRRGKKFRNILDSEGDDGLGFR